MANMTKKEKKLSNSIPNKSKERTYHAPRLEKLGDLRSLTLGPSGGSGESGPSDEHIPLFPTGFGG